jgi:hypothetical protein
VLWGVGKEYIWNGKEKVLMNEFYGDGILGVVGVEMWWMMVCGG